MVELSLVCNGLSESVCASQIAQALSPFFIFWGVVILVSMVAQIIYVAAKIKKHGKVFWIGIIMWNVSHLLLWVIGYFMMPLFIRWFNIIKIG